MSIRRILKRLGGNSDKTPDTHTKKETTELSAVSNTQVSSDSKTPRTVVLDVETTGLGRMDRIVEVAIITIDTTTGVIIDEYETLVNPQRDIGASEIHGITPSMVEMAPTFYEIAGTLSSKLSGSVLVGHNLPFDVRMLRQEFDRLDIEFDPGEGKCTYRSTGMSLESACHKYNIKSVGTHTAYWDALATAMLLGHLQYNTSEHIPALVEGDSHSTESHTATRTQRATNGLTDYRTTLDLVLQDQSITPEEQKHLNEIAMRQGLKKAEIERIQREYLAIKLNAADRDRNISANEHRALSDLCHAMNIDTTAIKPATTQKEIGELPPGTRVCFTGQAKFNGQLITRQQMQDMAKVNNFEPIENVTRQCDLLVTSDTSSNSGKAMQARKYGIPLMAASDFIKECQG